MGISVRVGFREIGPSGLTRFGIDVACLRLIELVVMAFDRHQLVVVADFDDLPRSMTTSRSALRSVDRRWAMAMVVRPRTRLSSAFWISFSVSVSTERCFVEDQDARVDQQRAGDRDALALAAGQAWPRSPTSES
jgi:hypothetical protein